MGTIKSSKTSLLDSCATNHGRVQYRTIKRDWVDSMCRTRIRLQYSSCCFRFCRTSSTQR